MSLATMGKSADSVRFMDDVDVTLTVDDRSNDSQQSTNIEISIKPVVFRASYRDIMLISTIVNKAVTLYANISHSTDGTKDAQTPPASRPAARSRASKMIQSQLHPVGHARALVAREQVSPWIIYNEIIFSMLG